MLTTGEAARRIGCSFRTLQRWIASGKACPDGKTVGGHHRFTEETCRALREEYLGSISETASGTSSGTTPSEAARNASRFARETTLKRRIATSRSSRKDALYYAALRALE